MKPAGTDRRTRPDHTTCPLCLSQADWALSGHGRDFHHCLCCDLIFVPAHQHPNETEQRARYIQHQNTAENKGYVDLLQRPIELLREHGPDIRRILDYGCGPNPVLVQLLHSAGYDAVGFDPLFAPNADISRPFDAVISIETFEHFNTPQDELRRILNLLHPSGFLAIMTMLHRGPDTIRNWWYARDVTHVTFYSSATVAWIGKAFGLNLLHCDNKRLILFKRTT